MRALLTLLLAACTASPMPHATMAELLALPGTSGDSGYRHVNGDIGLLAPGPARNFFVSLELPTPSQPLAFLYHGLVANKTAAGGGGPSWSNAKSIRFNDGGATNEFVTCGQPADVVGINHATTARTYSLWYKNNTTGTDCTYFAVAEQTNRPIQLYSVSGQPTLYLGTNQISYGTGSTSGTWYHFVATVSSAGAMRLYTNATSRATGTAGSAAQSYDIMMGARRNSANTGSAWLGPCNVDEVTIWTVEMNSTEVTELYSSGTPDDPTTHSQSANLIHYWRMGDGSDTTSTLYDDVGTADCTGNNLDAGDLESSVP